MASSIQPNLALNTIESSAIWRRLKVLDEPGALTSQVKDVATHSSALLTTVAVHMPLYTFHNERHVLNIIGWMDWLIGDQLQDYGAVECSLLLMAAYTHDLGMALSKGEHEELVAGTTAPTQERRNFEAFLDGFKEERQQMLRGGWAGERIRDHLLTEFLRRSHADRQAARMRSHLAGIEKRGVSFKAHGQSLQRHLLALNISHNQESDWLTNEIAVQPLGLVFGQEKVRLADLGSLLRLADVLDFDSSRTPTILFHHLGLERKMEDRWQTTSSQEWRKHLAIAGVRAEDGVLEYHAPECPDPATHKTILSFVEYINLELTSVTSLRLPIVKAVPFITEIRGSDGLAAYEYHDWSFRLAHQHIIELLMGESLYGDQRRVSTHLRHSEA